MIQEIRLENFLFMQKAELSFCKGLNVITGETGAGKSILLEAVKLLLGKKAKAGIVLPGKTSAKVQAVFLIENQPELQQFLGEAGFLNDDDPETLIVSRTFKEDGAGKIFVNGILATVSLLRQIGPYLMEIHGQNEHQTLLIPEMQRKYLDRTGSDEHLKNLELLSKTFHERQLLQQKYLELEQKQQHSAKRIQELQETVQDLERLNLSNPEEEDELKEDLRKLSHAEQIISMLQAARMALAGEDEQAGATSLFYKATDCLRKIADYDIRIAQAEERASSIFHEIQDLENELTEIAEDTELDPDRLYDVQARLAEISRICRKYGTDFKGLFDLHKSASEELSELYAPDSTKEKLRRALNEVESKYREITNQVSKERSLLAKKLEKAVSKEMETLGFNSATFKVVLTRTDPGKNGAEQIEFNVSLNPGAPGGPLRKIASGGELSRVALAIKKVLAQSDDLPTLLFDEIDAGIGGKTAESVAASLKALAGEKQVLLVTHLHQIAKEGDRHFTVDKKVENEITQVSIQRVEGSARVEEIARMLGQTDPEGMSFARSLLQKTLQTE
ncbi:MAG: DNA repair protein RecN [Candidatus Rifleibacteriota bacterium]